MDGLFDKIRKDLKQGIEEGIAVLKEGAIVVSGKMVKLKAEGKRQYKIFDLKSKIQSQMAELGGRTYDVLDSKKSLVADGKIKAVFVKIKKLEEQLRKLEGSKEIKATSTKKTKAKAKATPKKILQPSAKKTATETAKNAAAKK